MAENAAEARQARLPAPSMLAPGMPRSTPGIVRVRLTKLRPFKGSALICSSTTVCPRSEDEVLSSGVSAWISITSSMAPISRPTSMRTRWSTPTWMFVLETFLKPVISAVTL